MSLAKRRTSFALDSETIRLLHLLAERWRVSQAEVVRRAVRSAADADRADSESLSGRLLAYREEGRLRAVTAEEYLLDIDSYRNVWKRGSSK
jgi:hypothetical protein